MNSSFRIFRLIRDKRYADQEQIKKVAMIPDKEAKEHTYRLLEENFLKTQEFNKSSVPIGQLNKCFFYFWIDINMVLILLIFYKIIIHKYIMSQLVTID